MNRIKLCIFDMDGLLIDSERCVWSVGQKTIAKEFGVKMDDDFIKSVIGINHSTYIQLLTEKFGNDFDGERYLERLCKYYGDYCINNTVPLRPGVVELLNFLKQNKILISLGTSTESFLAKTTLQKLGILKYFDYTVCGDEVKNGKPNPEIFLKSVDYFGLKPEECVVFEDSQNGAKAAYDGGINLILVPDVKEPSSLDKEKAYAIIDSLHKAIPIIKKLNNID